MKPWFSEKIEMELEIKNLKHERDIYLERMKYYEDIVEKVKHDMFNELNHCEE